MRKVQTKWRNRIFGLFAMFAMAIGVGVSLAPKEEVKTSANEQTVEVSVAAYANANSWSNSLKYPTIVSGPFTLAGSGGTNSTKYYSASPGTWRFYSSDSPKGKIVITGDSTVEEITSVTSNPTKTWTISGNTASHEVSANTNFSSFTIKYLPKATGFGTLDRITLDYSAAKTKFAVMEEFSSNGLEVTAWDAQNNSKVVHTATTNFDEVTFGSQHKGSQTVTVSYTEGVTKTATYPITVTEARFFTEAKASELSVGATYTIVDPSTGMAIGAKSGSVYSNIEALTVDGPPKAILDNDDILEFELEAGSTLGSYAFKILNTDDVGKYISYTGSKNELHSADTVTNASSWIVTDTNVTNVGSGSRIIKYNPSAPRFAAYTSGQNDVKLYVDLDTVVVEPEYETTTKIEVSAGAVKDTWYVHETFAADGLVVVAHDENNGVHKILAEGEYSVDLEGTTFTGAHLGQQEVTVTYDGKSDSFNINVLEPRAFTKVTDMSQVQVGGEYVIGGEKDGEFYAISTAEANNRPSVGVAAINDEVFQNLDVQILKLHQGAETVPGSYAFESLGGAKDGMYLAATGTGTNNYLQSQATITERGSWMISLVEGVFSIVAEEAGTDRNVMRFNSAGTLFSAYGTGQLDVMLYVDTSTITQVDPAYAEAEQFANYVMGLTSEGDVTTADCEDNFLAAWLEWDELSPEAKVQFKTHADFAEARQRLTHWAFVNGGLTLDDLDSSGVQIDSYYNKPLNATLIIGLLGLTTIAGYYFLSRKEKLVK